jgi:hypothetical protein
VPNPLNFTVDKNKQWGYLLAMEILTKENFENWLKRKNLDEIVGKLSGTNCPIYNFLKANGVTNVLYVGTVSVTLSDKQSIDYSDNLNWVKEFIGFFEKVSTDIDDVTAKEALDVLKTL